MQWQQTLFAWMTEARAWRLAPVEQLFPSGPLGELAITAGVLQPRFEGIVALMKTP